MKYELSHDVLALKAYQRASADDKALRKVERLIKERYGFYKQRRTLLSKDDLDYIKPYLGEVAISEEEDEFIQRSRRFIRARKRILIALIVAVFLALSGLTAFALIQSRNAQQEKERAIEARELADKNAQIAQEKEAEAQKERDNAFEARNQADKNAQLAEAREKEANLQKNLAEKSRDEAELARDEAEIARQEANENAKLAKTKEEEALAQRQNADQNARRANALRILALAQSLMAIADQIEDPILKAKLANQAYIFHSLQNGDPYDPVIHNGLRSALIANDWANSVNQHQSAIMDMAFSPDGQYLFSTARDGKLIQWKWNEQLEVVNTTILANPLITQGGLSMNEEWLAVSGDQTPELEIFKLADFPKPHAGILGIDQPTNDLAFHRQQKHQLILATSEGLRYKDLETPRTNSTTFIFPQVSIQTLDVDYSGKWIAGITSEGKIAIGYVEGQENASTFEQVENAQSLAFSQNEKFFAAGDKSGKVWIYDFKNGELLASLSGHNARVSQVEFLENSDYTFLVSAGYDGKAQLWFWNTKDNDEIKEQLSTRLPIVLKADENWEFSLTISPDGKYILIGDRNGVIQQWLVNIEDMVNVLRQNISDLKLSEDEWKQYLKEEEYPH